MASAQNASADFDLRPNLRSLLKRKRFNGHSCSRAGNSTEPDLEELLVQNASN